VVRSYSIAAFLLSIHPTPIPNTIFSSIVSFIPISFLISNPTNHSANQMHRKSKVKTRSESRKADERTCRKRDGKARTNAYHSKTTDEEKGDRAPRLKKTQHPDFRHKPRHPQHTTQKEQSNKKTRIPISTPSTTPVNHKYTKIKIKEKDEGRRSQEKANVRR